MELPVNTSNGDDSEMDTDDDVSEPLSYDMSFGDSSPPDNKWPFKEWSNELCKKKTTALLITLIIKF